jgi:predicted nucleotidyltransferase
MPVQDKQEIFALLVENESQLRRLGVRRCGLFGSFARGEQNERSDVDILVEFEAEQKTFDNFMALAFYLEDLFGRKVDLLTPESLSPYIGPHILREVEYETDGRRVNTYCTFVTRPSFCYMRAPASTGKHCFVMKYSSGQSCGVSR